MGITRPSPGRPDLFQRLAILAALGGLVALSWLYLVDEAATMAAMDPDMAMPPKDATELLLLLAMWCVMMVGMMLPSAAPMILTFATINRNRRASGRPYTPTALFTSGYLLAWVGFSVVATFAQAGLEWASLFAPMAMKITSPLLGGLLFIAAGVYQFTPLKHACLSFCRSPIDFVVNHWHDGPVGAVRMGISHGLYCLGCCWILMALLFAVGVMDLVWVAILTAVVLVEKLMPAGPWLARVGGLLLIGYGVGLLTL
jgi:predicted metal-binding membrane protein